LDTLIRSINMEICGSGAFDFAQGRLPARGR